MWHQFSYKIPNTAFSLPLLPELTISMTMQMPYFSLVLTLTIDQTVDDPSITLDATYKQLLPGHPLGCRPQLPHPTLRLSGLLEQPTGLGAAHFLDFQLPQSHPAEEITLCGGSMPSQGTTSTCSPKTPDLVLLDVLSVAPACW